MEEKRHAPGPWRHQEGIIWSNHGRVAEVCFSGLHDEESDEADDANADLIASAPLLKEQVRILREALEKTLGALPGRIGPTALAAIESTLIEAHAALEATKKTP